VTSRDEAHDAPPVSGDVSRDERQRQVSAPEIHSTEGRLARLEARRAREAKQLDSVLAASAFLKNLPGDRLFDEVLRLFTTELDHDRALVLAPCEADRYDIAESAGFDKHAILLFREAGFDREMVDRALRGDEGVAALLADLDISDGLAKVVPYRAEGPLVFVVGRSRDAALLFDPIEGHDRRVFALLIAAIEAQLDNQALVGRISTEHRRQNEATRALKDKLAELEQLRSQLHSADRFAALGTFLGGVFEQVEQPIDHLAERLEVVASGAGALVKAFEVLSASHVKRVPTAFAEVSALETRFDLARWIAAVPEAASRARADAEEVRNLARAARRLASPVDEEASRRIDVRCVLEDAIAVAKITIEKRATFETRIEPTPPVRAAAPRLAQVVLSLLANAVEALPDGGPGEHVVRLTSQPEEHHVLITVEDSGHGIDPAIENQICEPFFTTRQDRSALGLGLTVAKHVVASCKGELSFQSRPGYTRFEVRLPIAATSAPSRTRR
jgi:signal transduction histidine kinase